MSKVYINPGSQILIYNEEFVERQFIVLIIA